MQDVIRKLLEIQNTIRLMPEAREAAVVIAVNRDDTQIRKVRVSVSSEAQCACRADTK